MEVSVVTRVTINASSKEVFCYLSHLKYHYLWNPHLRKITPIVALKRGLRYEVESTLLGMKIGNINKVSKLTKNKEVEIMCQEGPVKYCVNYRLHPMGEKTQVLCTTDVTAASNYFSFAKPVLKSIARHELQTDMQALKLAVEHKLV
jgi:hypothetical protein